MNYLSKAVLQRLLSHLPSGYKINEFLRGRNVSMRLPFYTLSQCLRQIELLQKYQSGIEGKTILELGTGWKPVFPLCYRLLGADKVITVDINRCLSHKYLQLAFADLQHHLPRLRNEIIERDLNPSIFERNLEHFTMLIRQDGDLDKILASLGIVYAAPADARSLDLPCGSVDIYKSRAVMEHIPEESILQIYREAHRILEPSGGCMIHDIDISDHWSYFDTNLTRIHFLQMDGFHWNFINSPIAFQNRLRQSQHLELIEETGYKIVQIISQKNSLSEEHIERLRGRLASPFRSLPTEELQVSEFTVFARVRNC